MERNLFLESKLFKILIILYSKGDVTIDFLSEELEVTTRSIRNYVKDINNILDDIGEITLSPNQKLTLSIYNTEEFERLIEENQKENYQFNSKDDRIKYLITELFYYGKHIKIDDLCEEMNVSRTTILKDIKLVEAILSKYGLELEKTQNRGIMISGFEINKRLMAINYLFIDNSTNIFESRFFKNIEGLEWNTLENELLKHFKTSDHKITGDTFKHLINYIVIMVFRLSIGKTVHNLDVKYNLLRGNVAFKESKKIVEIISDVLKIEISEEEQIFMTIPLASSNAPFENSREDIQYDEQTYLLVTNILKSIFIRTGIRIQDDIIKKNLATHLQYTINRLIFNVYHGNSLLEEIKSNYRYSYELAKISADFIEESFGLEVPDDEIGFIAMHFMNHEEYKSEIIEQINNVALICDSGKARITFITNKLKRILPKNVQIDVIASFDLELNTSDEYDIIFSTVNNEFTKIMLESSNSVININTLLDEKEFRTKMESIMYRKVQGPNKSGIDTDFLSDYLSRDLFIKINRVSTLDSLFSNISNLIKSSITLEEDVVEKLLRREEISSTIYENGIMLPHTTNKNLDEPVIVIAVSKDSKPIYKNVTLVSMILFPETYEENVDNLIRIYDEIIKISRDKKLIQELSQSENIYEFINLIEENNTL